MANREKREFKENVHLYLALSRPSKGGDKSACIRTVIKNEETDLAMLEAKLKIFGGKWRIHKTVNIRNCEKARKILIKHLIDHPEQASCIDILWRTALLQKDCKETKYFMLDIDTQDEEKINILESLIPKSLREDWDKSNYILSQTIRKKVKSPNGWHYITLPFDTREICKLDYVTLKRDGYYYVKSVN